MTASWLLLVPVGVAAGLVLGGVFFGGLWVTARRLTSAHNAALLVGGSYLGRTAALAVGLGLLARSDPALFAGGVVGVIGARAWWLRAVGPTRAEVDRHG